MNMSAEESVATAKSTSATGILDVLARLPAQSIVDEHALAQALGISVRTIPRWVVRGHLPAGAKLGGRTVWMPGRILEHIAHRLEEAGKAAERRAIAQQRQNEGLTTCVGANSRPPVKASR